jgi:hypothetical protein
MDNYNQFKGKTASSILADKDRVEIYFEDGSRFYVNLESYNISCHCHPEYVHELECEAILSDCEYTETQN